MQPQTPKWLPFTNYRRNSKAPQPGRAKPFTKTQATCRASLSSKTRCHRSTKPSQYKTKACKWQNEPIKKNRACTQELISKGMRVGLIDTPFITHLELRVVCWISSCTRWGTTLIRTLTSMMGTILMAADLRTITRTCTLRVLPVCQLLVALTRRLWLRPQRRWSSASTITPVWPTL